MINKLRIAIIGFPFVFVLLVVGTAHSQPYIFYASGMTLGSLNSNIYRLDLSTGDTTLFIPDLPNYAGLTVDPTDQWVYINYGQGGAYLIIASVTDTSKVYFPLVNQTNVSGFAGVIYVPQANKFYVTWLTPDSVDGGNISETTIYSVSPFKKLGNIDFGFTFADEVSPDGQYIYQVANDSLGNRELLTFSTATNSVVKTQPLLNAGPATPDKATEASANNRILFSWIHPGDNPNLTYYYSVYDIATGSNLPSINFPLDCDASLSADGNYIILNTWNSVITDSTNSTGYAIYPGTVYVFNANTGQLTQRLSLPPGGKVLVIPGYPKMFYYYNDSTHASTPVNATKVMPVKGLLDTLISLKEQCVANGSIDNQGIANSLDSKLDNAKSRLAAGDSTAAKNMLQAFVNEVEAQKGKHLTMNAYLSLKFNAEYVIGRLP